MSSDDFVILTVCTGNICRSPLAEQLLRVGLEHLPVALSSAGTIAVPGAAMPEPAQSLSLRLGGDPAAHSARRLIEGDIANADLVLVMAREHRAAVARMVPRANRTTFTIREFARLAESIDDAELDRETPAQTLVRDRLRRAVALVQARRGFVIPPKKAGDDDVVDPYQRGDKTYARSGAQVTRSVNTVVSFLRRAAVPEGS